MGKDTKHLSQDCAMAEIMLFVCKLAIEKENSRANIIPIYSNDGETMLGKYLKAHFKKVPRQSVLHVSKSLDVIHYICMKALLTESEFEKQCIASLLPLVGIIDDYYDAYIRYYKLIK